MALRAILSTTGLALVVLEQRYLGLLVCRWDSKSTLWWVSPGIHGLFNKPWAILVVRGLTLFFEANSGGP